MTLNQQYKMSGSEKPFKEWLFERQASGELDLKKEDMNKTVNASGQEKVSISIFGIPMWGIALALGVIIVGGIIYNRSKK
jgi:hypothetical protein